MAGDIVGPLKLSHIDVDYAVGKVYPGCYILAKEENGKIRVKDVGRGESNLNEALKPFIGGEYNRFWFCYTNNAQDAFETHCQLYHSYDGEKNLATKEHPVSPEGKDWKCPVCG